MSNDRQIKAIETEYHGRRYRSRLEARWSIVFERLGIFFDYEHEGFVFDDGTRYLPDFWLKEQNAWVEIKGGDVSNEAVEKMELLIESHARTNPTVRGFILNTIPSPTSKALMDFNQDDTYSVEWIVEKDPSDSHISTEPDARLAQCPICGKIDIIAFGMGTSLPCGCAVPLFDDIYSVASKYSVQVWMARRLSNAFECFNTPSLLESYDIARMARFEHGRHSN